MAIFVPATGETDQKKQNMSLQLIGGIVTTNTTNIATNTASIAAHEAAWTAYTPTVFSLSGTITTASATGRYKAIGKTVFASISVTITTNGTGATAVCASLPTAAKASPVFAFVGKELNVTGKAVAAGPNDVNTIFFQYYDSTYPGANGTLFYISGCYEAA